MPMCQNHQTSTAPLTIKGWNDNPIAPRIVTLDGVYYIMTKCTCCVMHMLVDVVNHGTSMILLYWSKWTLVLLLHSQHSLHTEVA